MSKPEEFYELLFEVSNEDRDRILHTLHKEKKRVSDISRELNLTYPEIRRHISRLEKIALIQRDLKGYYHLTPYGETSILLFQDFTFLSSNRVFFKTHTLSNLPVNNQKHIGELQGAKYISNAMDFFLQTDRLIEESKEYVWLLVDQFPLNSLSSILEAIERGVKFKIIEPTNRIIVPNLESLTSYEISAINRTRITPLVNQLMLDEINVFLFLSENRCVLTFPLSNGKFDYTGFTSTEESSLQWCKELFRHYWDRGEERVSTPSINVKWGEISEGDISQGQVVVVGTENPDVDAQAVQDAVDNFDEVILKGTFNFGSSFVRISKSLILRGAERENDIPRTTVYKSGWSFPFREFDSVFVVWGEGIDVTIENIFFTDFNCSCIRGWQGNSLHVKNNRITLQTGYGRGITFGAFGDILMGISIEGGPFESGEIVESRPFEGGVIVEGNYIDFKGIGMWSGHVSRGGLEDDPEHRPDLFNHEYYISYGIMINGMSGDVRIDNNIVRNSNGSGITSGDNELSANVVIKDNIIESDVYGSYSFIGDEAGSGIRCYSARASPNLGFHLEIIDNTIALQKVNYSGIVVHGPFTEMEGSDKLRGGIIRNNRIHLNTGYEGIHVRMCDDFEVEGNEISGEAYYGIKISGQKDSGKLDLRALGNMVVENDMCGLQIRDSDGYSDNHIDGRMFAGSDGKAVTSHIWLNEFSSENSVKIKSDETVIDEGKNNIIEKQ